MSHTWRLASAIALLPPAACTSADRAVGRESLRPACSTNEGIGWLKLEYGEKYCGGSVNQAKAVPSDDRYRIPVGAAKAFDTGAALRFTADCFGASVSEYRRL